jgi:hypothetical protein
MRVIDVKMMTRFAFLFLASLVGPGLAHAQWTAVNNAPNASTCLLLTDGSVMCQNGEQTKSWQRLKPDEDGHYATGTWSALPDLPQPSPIPPGYAPLYYASGVLPNGKVFVIGGEYNNGFLGCKNPPPNNCPTTSGFVFDPTANGGAGKWSGPIAVPAGYTGSDSQSVILADGTVLVADISTSNIFKLDSNALTLTQVAASGKLDANDEEGWESLPDGTVLTVDANNTTNISSGGGTAYEIYSPTTKSWSSPGFTPVNLTDITSTGTGSREIGPSVLRPDGTVIYFGGNLSGQNATYSTITKTWQTAATFPMNAGKQLTVADGPASILPDGNVLVEASPGVVGGVFGTGSRFFEFDTTGALTDVTGNGGPSVASQASFKGRMLVLPSGEILYTHGSNEVFLYTNTGTPKNAWRPVITSAPGVLGPGDTYTIAGNLFNGLSRGASYGDDAQMATDYPLVRITNIGSGHVFYARTHDHNRMGVESVGDATVVTTSFDVPATLEFGVSTLVVVANGIPSAATVVSVEPATSLAFTSTSATTADFNDPAQVQAVLTTGGVGLGGEKVTFVLGSGGSAPTCSAMTDSSGTATCTLTPNQPAGPETLTATFASNAAFAGSAASAPFIVTHEQAALAFTAASATTADFDDPAKVQAQLTTDGAPLSNRTVTFVLGPGASAPRCSAVSDAAGNATCTLTPNQPAGLFTLTATFVGDAFYIPASAAVTFKVTKEETTLSYTGDKEVTNGTKANLSGVLLEDNVVPINGRLVKFTLGSGATAQSCTGTTNALGVAVCSIDPVAQPRGAGLATDVFAGDAFYLPSSAHVTTLVIGFPDAVRLSTKPNPSTVGQSVKLVAVVVARPGLPDPPVPSTPTGSVTFYDLSTPLGTVNLDATAVATLNVKFAKAGQHSITAKYSGDTIFVPSSATVKQNVK